MKTNICATVDMDIIIELRKRKLPVSKLINGFFMNYLEMPKKEDISPFKIDEELATAKVEVMRLEEEKQKIQKKIAKGHIRIIN